MENTSILLFKSFSILSMTTLETCACWWNEVITVLFMSCLLLLTNISIWPYILSRKHWWCTHITISAMSSQDENDAISALTGFSLNHVLDGLQLPAGTNLSNQLGISGIPTLSSTQIYNDKWEDEEDAIGADQGEDWEAEIDKEMMEEVDRDSTTVKKEVMSPGFQPKQKRTRIIKRLVERPKSVYELFPSYDKNKILDFTEILKGNTARKSRLGKRHYLGVYDWLHHPLHGC